MAGASGIPERAPVDIARGDKTDEDLVLADRSPGPSAREPSTGWLAAEGGAVEVEDVVARGLRARQHPDRRVLVGLPLAARERRRTVAPQSDAWSRRSRSP